jgi:dephospho-CoA kinase
MVVLGITGGIGSGKGLATRFFRERGAAIIDADEVARAVVQPGSPVLAELAATFGRDVVQPGGGLDRRSLAERVFGKPELVAALNAITHPAIRREIDRRLAELRVGEGVPVVCVVAPLLLEAGYRRTVDRLLVLWAEEEERVRRVMARDGVTREDVKGRMQAQMSPEEQRQAADWVVDTTESQASALRQLEAIWEQLVGPRRNDG